MRFSLPGFENLECSQPLGQLAEGKPDPWTTMRPAHNEVKYERYGNALRLMEDALAREPRNATMLHTAASELLNWPEGWRRPERALAWARAGAALPDGGNYHFLELQIEALRQLGQTEKTEPDSRE